MIVLTTLPPGSSSASFFFLFSSPLMKDTLPWFTSVMGTGILAIDIMNSPVKLPFFVPLAQFIWTVDAILMAILLVFWLLNAICYPARFRASLANVAPAQTWGAPPIACFTLATGFLVIGSRFLNPALSLHLAQILWLLGVAGSLFSAIIIPYLMFTSHEVSRETTYGNWLLPVVPPIVASVPGALLASTWPTSLRTDLFVLTSLLWSVGLALAAIIIVLFYARLAYQKVPPAALVPTMWLVVGPLGQSVDGINALGNVAPHLLPADGPTLQAAGLIFGIPLWGFGFSWLLLSLIVTVRTAYKHLPFNLGWWAFTFPVGVLTAGSYALFGRTQTPLFEVGGVFLLALLAVMWVLVAIRTIHHISGALKGIPDSLAIMQ